MKLPITSNERAIEYGRIFLALFWSIPVAMTNPKCRQPEITSPRPHLFLYQQTTPVNLTVHHCLYREVNECNKDICKNCRVGLYSYTVKRSLTYQYSDITENCLNASKTYTFKDKYGYKTRTNESTSYNYTCQDDTLLRKTITVDLTKYDVEAIVSQNKIVLNSGTACRYDSGFCYDENEEVDVVWEVEEYLYGNEDIICYHLQRIDVSDAYFFILNEKRYAIVELDEKYFVLELKNNRTNCNVTTWDTDRKGLIVTEKSVTTANNTPLELDLGFFFGNKRDLYGFLIEYCLADSDNPNGEVLKKSFLSELKIEYQSKYLRELEAKIESLSFRWEVFFYVIIFIVLCLTGAVITLSCRECKKTTKSVPFVAPKSVSYRQNVSIGNAYEYITSEYNINSIYKRSRPS